MERRLYRDDFEFHVELWEPPARPMELFAAAVDKEVAVAMARETQKQRPGVRVRLIGNPQRHGIPEVDTQELVFHLERWRADGNGFDRTLAVTKNVLVARVGYRAAIDRRFDRLESTEPPRP